MSEPWNCWPGGVCLSTLDNVAIGLIIAGMIVVALTIARIGS